MVDREPPASDRHLSVGVLGPFEVSLAGRPVTLTARRLRALLAALAVWAPDPVSADRLTSAIWEEDLPETPRRTLQLYVTRLRGFLGAGSIVTSPTGYALTIEPGRVDALRFSRLLDGLAAAPDAAAERELLAEALRLWRGTPFEGVQSAWLEKSVAAPLLERYLTAVERWADLAVDESDSGDLIPLLGELVSQYPLRESLWVRLLVATAGSGRPAEALDLYEVVRKSLAEELGTNPGPELRQVHADLLAGRSPTTTGIRRDTADRAVPRQLPTDVAGFTGRDEEMSALDQMVPADVGTATIYAISGSAGVGKSALAIHAAHRLSGRFPDGQLYVNLQGATAGLRPLAPLDVLGRFLRALGADAASVLADVEEAGALFRSVVAARRLLIVLDNAADSAQVRPLLPATPGCTVLVTSRRMLADLAGARHLRLDVLASADALTLLGRIAGPARITEEPEAASEVARWCGNLPLALRIAGARLAARPAWPVAALAERLADTQRRLDELELAEVGVRASFAVSHQQLTDSTDPVDRAGAQAFGLIGVLDGPDVSTPVAARLLDLSQAQAERGLERLVDAHLLETPLPGRYRLHDLLRLYAREQVAEHDPDLARSSALTRVLGFYVATAWHTLDLLRPGDYRLGRADERWLTGGLQFPDTRAALEWLEAERANLLTAVQQGARNPAVPPELAIQLAQALFGYLSVRCYWEDRIQVNQTALAVATRLGDHAAQGQALVDLGLSRFRQGRYDEAVANHREARAIFRRLGDRHGLAASAGGLGFTLERLGRHDEALVHLQESLAINQELGDRRGMSTALSNLGETYLRLNRPDKALDCLLESLAIDRELDDRWGESIDLLNLGKVNERLGRYDDALACYQNGLAINREADDPDGVAHCLNGLGAVHRRRGRLELALGCHRESLAIQRELGDPYCLTESLRELGLTLQATGRVEEAGQHLHEALSILEQLQSSDADEIRALVAHLQ
jgi:DNA-binding SARP family transcriptional activator/tetratricopeptide (TPR) repeat protein